jgi:WD40 repeat protein
VKNELFIFSIYFQVSRHSVSVGSGITKMSWRNSHPDEVLVATLDGFVRVVDVRQGKVVAECSGHEAAVLDMDQSK